MSNSIVTIAVLRMFEKHCFNRNLIHQILQRFEFRAPKNIDAWASVNCHLYLVFKWKFESVIISRFLEIQNKTFR